METVSEIGGGETVDILPPTTLSGACLLSEKYSILAVTGSTYVPIRELQLFEPCRAHNYTSAALVLLFNILFNFHFSLFFHCAQISISI